MVLRWNPFELEGIGRLFSAASALKSANRSIPLDSSTKTFMAKSNRPSDASKSTRYGGGKNAENDQSLSS